MVRVLRTEKFPPLQLKQMDFMKNLPSITKILLLLQDVIDKLDIFRASTAAQQQRRVKTFFAREENRSSIFCSIFFSDLQLESINLRHSSLKAAAGGGGGGHEYMAFNLAKIFPATSKMGGDYESRSSSSKYERYPESVRPWIAVDERVRISLSCLPRPQFISWVPLRWKPDEVSLDITKQKNTLI